MNVGMLSSQQVRSLVEDKWQRDIDAVAVGLHVASSMQGPGEVEFEFGNAKVVRADTVFEVREALLGAEKDNTRIVVLTGLQQNDLGHDVVGRLARSRLFPVDHWASLCSLFKAKELDRSICEPAIAQALMEYAPPDGYPPVSAGLLDGGTVWRAICRHVFDMGEREPDLVSLLLWASSEKGTKRYEKAGEEIGASLRRRLVHNLGDAADSILNFIESKSGPDALALAVVCQVVFGAGDYSTLDAAAARMEQYHGNKPIPKTVGRTLGKIAVDAIADLDRHDDPRIAQQHLQRADELIKQFLCEDHAHRNTLSRLSFEQRLGRLGHAIKTAVEETTEDKITACEVRLEEIAEHRMAKLGRNKDQVSKAEMAVRLVRWLKQKPGKHTSFADQANYHIKEMSFVDWAREPLCRGEDVADLSAAYQLLDQTVLKIREERSHAFAKSLADWTAVGSKQAGVLGVEDVLSSVVSKVVEAGNKVLLVVLDGMSWAVCHELLEDIRQDHWFESTLDESGAPPAPVIATIPSVTNYSRATLLSGKLTHGAQNVEDRNFREHKALVEACDKRYPPVLFHKKDITEGNRGAVSEELSKKVLSQVYKAVGVVINAIDDRLANAQQVIDHWSLSRINPLRALLRLARDSGRVVILASDHGHVWHRPDGTNRRHDDSSRWRMNDGKCMEDEIVIEGERVVAGEKSIIVPWSEGVYYKVQHNGYHGGATPQEMVCPLILLTDKTSAYTGLVRCEYPKPDWWSAAPVATPKVEEPQVTITVPQKVGPPTLFDMEPEEKPASKPEAEAKPTADGANWIVALLKSQAYKDQKAMIRRHPVENDVMQACLSALAASGGIMTPTAFAKAAEVSMARLDGLVVKMQRVLNVDGYEILTLDRNENRVELNVGKLKRQFDLD
ncbi:BREX-2 system phosphatase PglZ [Planctomycetales bacterium 10988]|nr:BREX-2 system phosphatase PglZ [Planctomycetales bacterium 10988]